MSSKRPLQSVDPKPISGPDEDYYRPSKPDDQISYSVPGRFTESPDTLPEHTRPSDLAVTNTRAQPYPQSQHQQYTPDSGIALHMKPGSHIPDHPGSTFEIPRPPAQTFTQEALTAAPRDLRMSRSTCAYNLKEYISLQRGRRGAMEGDVEMERQRGLVVRDLRALASELRGIARKGEEQRWRKLMMGGILSTFIPLVRRIFRRDPNARDETTLNTTNDTEYAWFRSGSLIARIKESLTVGKGGWLASIAFFVFSVMYVFQNEVEIRVARTMGKRLRKLRERVERGGEDDVREEDLAILEGWRWKILL